MTRRVGRHHAQAGRDGHRGRARQLAQAGRRHGRVRRPAVRGVHRQGRLGDPQPVRRRDRWRSWCRRGRPCRSAPRWCGSAQPGSHRRARRGPAAVGPAPARRRGRLRRWRSGGAADGRLGGAVRRGPRPRSAPAGEVHDITMPKLGETVTEGTIGSWLKQAGDTVAFDDPLFEVSTDKVDSEIPSPYDGVLLEILVPAGETVPVGTPLARIGEPGAHRRPVGEPRRPRRRPLRRPCGRVGPGGDGRPLRRPAAAARCSRRWCAGWRPRTTWTWRRSRAPVSAAGSAGRTSSRPSRAAAPPRPHRAPAAAPAAPAPRPRRPPARGAGRGSRRQPTRPAATRATRSSRCPGCGWRSPAG